MTKVAILGNAGGGKSTLCKLLSTAKNLPVYQLDKLQWNPGWIASPPDEFNARHDQLLNRDRWIIDGVATFESINSRLKAADTIIFIDHPLWVHYWWAAKRQFMCIFRPRPDFIPGCPMLPKTWELAKMIWQIDKHLKPAILKLIAENSEGKQIFHIRSPRELKEFQLTHCSD